MYIVHADKVFKEEDLYICYDKNEKDALLRHGIPYIYLKVKDGEIVWYFYKNKKLQDALKALLEGGEI